MLHTKVFYALLTLFVGTLAAQTPPEFQMREHTGANGEAFKYLVYVPRNLEAGKPTLSCSSCTAVAAMA